jgi:hypothetical protein
MMISMRECMTEWMIDELVHQHGVWGGVRVLIV